jgi:hypothetical protein
MCILPSLRSFVSFVVNVFTCPRFLFLPITCDVVRCRRSRRFQYPHPAFSILCCKQSTFFIRPKRGPSVAQGWPKRGPGVAQGWPNPKPNGPHSLAAFVREWAESQPQSAEGRKSRINTNRNGIPVAPKGAFILLITRYQILSTCCSHPTLYPSRFHARTSSPAPVTAFHDPLPDSGTCF